MKKAVDKLKNNYIVVQSWMARELGLKGNRLLVYAIVYGFSQTEKQVCSCGLDYFQAWTNSTKQGVLNTLDSLESDGLIERVKNIGGDKRKVAYRAIGQQSLPNYTQKGKESLPILEPQKGKESLPNLEKKVKKVYLNRSTKFTQIGQQSCRATDNNKNNNIYTDEDEYMRVKELLSSVVFDCKPIYSQEEYLKARCELNRSYWARENLTHLSKIHRVWEKLISGFYRDRNDSPSVYMQQAYSADELNAAFAKLNEEL